MVILGTQGRAVRLALEKTENAFLPRILTDQTDQNLDLNPLYPCLSVAKSNMRAHFIDLLHRSDWNEEDEELSMKRKRTAFSAWMLGIGIGAVLGVLVVLKMAAGGPNSIHPVSIYGEDRHPPQPNPGAEIQVTIFGIWKYSRTSAHYEDFDTEIAILSYTPSIIVFLICCFMGGYFVRLFDRWICCEFRSKDKGDS